MSFREAALMTDFRLNDIFLFVVICGLMTVLPLPALCAAGPKQK